MTVTYNGQRLDEDRIVYRVWRALRGEREAIEKAHPGAMVAIYVPAAMADTLAIPGGEPAQDLHITLAFLGDDASKLDEAAVNALRVGLAVLASRTAPLDGYLSGHGFFAASKSDPTVVYATADLPGLVELRQEVCELVCSVGLELPSEHDYTPHITLAYAEPGEPWPIADVPAGAKLEIGAVSLVTAGARTDYPLTGSSAAYARKSETWTVDDLDTQAQRIAEAAAELGMTGEVDIDLIDRGADGVVWTARSGGVTVRFRDYGDSVEKIEEPRPPEADRVEILRKSPAQRYTLGVVYPARRVGKAGGKDVDAHSDYMTAEEVESAAWRFMAKPDAGLMHKDGTGGAGVVVESYVYRGPTWKAADQTVEAGDWLLGVVWSEKAWSEIEAGRLTGYSLQGFATRESE